MSKAGEVVQYNQLKAKDVVTAISLKTGEVKDRITVTYVAWSFKGFDYVGGDAKVTPHIWENDGGPWVLIRWPEDKVQMPDYWPPKPGDLWVSGPYEYLIQERGKMVSRVPNDIQPAFSRITTSAKLVYRRGVLEAGK